MEDLDPITGLLQSKSLAKEVQSVISSNSGKDSNAKWVLGLLDVDGLKAINEEKGYIGADLVIVSIATVIKNFTQDDPQRLKAYKIDKQGKGDLFGLLIRYKETNFIKRNIDRLISTIYDNTSQVGVSVGITSIRNKDTTYDDCYEKALECLKIAKENGGQQYYWDINDIKKMKDVEYEPYPGHAVLGNKHEFQIKLRKVARQENENWILALIDGDNVGKLKATDVEQAANAIEELYIKITRISINSDCHCFGYLFGGDEFAIIFWDPLNNSKIEEDTQFEYDVEEDIKYADILQGLIKSMESTTDITISVGFARVKSDELATEWIERANKNLSIAKQNGKNQSYPKLETDADDTVSF